jgi:hypothetical protein
LLTRFIYIAAFFLVSTTFFSCNPARRVPEGRYLLNRNKIVIEDAEIKRAELSTYFRQRPNRRILGIFRFHLHVYNLADGARSNRLTRWMKNTIGEPPVIYDHTMRQNTMRQFELYMHSKGYFNAEISFEEKTRNNNKASIIYTIRGNTPYYINQITYNIPDSYLKGFVLRDSLNTVVSKNMRYDADAMHEERNRITRNLRNDGYYRFSRDFIFFQVDSALNNHRVNIEMRINDPVGNVVGFRDSIINLRHKRYRIDQITLFPDYSPLAAQIPRKDTTLHIIRDRRADRMYEYRFLHDGPLRIKPSAIVNHVMLRPRDYFRISDVEQTYSFLSEMRNFRYINLQFTELDNPLGTPNDTLGFIAASVQLNRSAANAFTIEAEGLNTAGNLGVASNVLFQNRNIFRGAEIFNLRLKGALEVSGESRAEEVIQRLPFNTLELGVEAGVDFPKLLLPIPIGRLSRNSRPKSSIVAGINFRQRPDYTRYVINMNYGFEWNETSRKRHFIYPLEVSSVRVYNDSILRANIPQANPFILSRFKDHLIMGTKYTYVYNTQRIGKSEDFVYLHANFESAGNLLNLVTEPLNMSKDENGSFTIFKIPFSQFVKGDADYRIYKVFDPRQTLVFRAMGGVGLPYGNVSVLPFIKSYYGGGANGLRAWKIYTLGPGSYKGTDEIRFDRYGDIKLELNLEYRFKLYSFWHGAFFLDAGNVWFVNKNEQFPGGEFQFANLGNDLAIGGGMGIRMDFSFFILRVDAAVPIKNPAFPFNEQWINSWPAIKDFNLNLGIGYPF